MIADIAPLARACLHAASHSSYFVLRSPAILFLGTLFFARPGEKQRTLKIKYHAAAG
jgi:hypothetical protein